MTTRLKRAAFLALSWCLVVTVHAVCACLDTLDDEPVAS